MRRLIDNNYILWAIFAVPAVVMVVSRYGLHSNMEVLNWSGIFSAWFLILALAVTPLQTIFGPLPWLRKRRRYLGVASFCYASLHTLVWLMAANIGKLLRSLQNIDIVVGWIALGIMALLAATSYDLAVRKLGRRWKSLQRWVYLAAILTLAHWWWLAEDKMDVVIYCTPLVLLEIWRVVRNQQRTRGA